MQEKIELGDRPWSDRHFLIQLQDPEKLLSSLSLVFQKFLYKKTLQIQKIKENTQQNERQEIGLATNIVKSTL